ncbi:MAG: PTS sugar transporter subunit IIA [Deltaproteobacteria bacterium]|nr:PTS sugar transporter subunit IIA [Candidatus Anaeroferrophillacea bacterium]
MNAILAVSILVIAGLLGGRVAKRLHLPGVTGQIVIGVLIGPSVANILPHDVVYHTLQPISSVALGLIAVTIASHLRLNRAPGRQFRVTAIAAGQVVGSFLAVLYACQWVLDSWPVALLLAAIAVSTAAAAPLAVVRETEARGPLVKTMLAVIAVDNVMSLLLYVVVAAVAAWLLDPRPVVAGAVLVEMARDIGLSLGLGIAVSGGLLVLSRRLREKYQYVTAIAVAIFFTTGVAVGLGVSPLLPNMMVGFLISNFSPLRREILTALDDLEPLIFISFFTLAGTHLDVALLPRMGLVGLVYMLARYGGKVAGAWFGGILSGSEPVVRRNLGLCLVPQAGIAIGLVIALQENPRFIACEPQVTVVVLAAVVISELVGPVLIKRLLISTGEAGREGRQLFGIVPRKAIKLPLRAVEKWAAIEELVDFAVEVYDIPAEQRAPLLASVIEREKSLSTGIGKGIAIPHGTVAGGRAIRGVMGICSPGIDFQSLDGARARVIILMLIPSGCFRDHLRVLAEISKVMSRAETVARLAAAESHDAAYHIVFTEENEPSDFRRETEA